MPKVVARQIELELTLDQILSIVRQLKPQEQELVRRVIEPPPWSRRLEALLTRVWSRVERYPIAEKDVEAEAELARTELYAPGSH